MRKQLTVGSLIPGRSDVQMSSPAPVPVHTHTSLKKTDPARPQSEQKLVQVKQRSQTMPVRYIPSETLLQAALTQDQPIAYKCQQGHCGKCSVQIVAGASLLETPTGQEKAKLGEKLATGYRLACQSTFRSSIPT
ncbi:2Fe-2S iron-sulfur cluster-binding protein [Brevibacillus sp. MER 51]|uniref:2Fe-2S iron-sulfur cluster-binding protein n=1 Tax=Brevibacillus sp. MER 51 TaxID=2939560 RepID=UPI002041F802|nr:2Fe-2S iron-sulfur cluster-binding protein [Brevibacillus sp. MER 51]MCM3143574.1 (2Fe-2S)-binding protein [Brevibacillus sp. MER 51]